MPVPLMLGLFAVLTFGCALGVSIIPKRRRPRRSDADETEARSSTRERAGGDRSLRTVSVVVPSLNEEGSIDWVLEHIPSWVSEIVLVDGLSNDFTEVIARRARADIVVVHQRQRGKGAALRAGFAAATGDIIVMIDADGSTDPREMGRFVDALESGVDFVKGSRHLPGGGSVDFTMLRRAGNHGFVALVNLVFGLRFTDLCYGYCAFWRHHLDALALTADGFEIETQLILNAGRAGLVIGEVPSVELERRAGSSNLNTFRDGRRVLKTIIHTRIGTDVPAVVPSSQIDFLSFEVASHESEAWRPAGLDDRRGQRRSSHAASGYGGPERRRTERRAHPGSTSVVFVVSDGGPGDRELEPDAQHV